MPTRGSATAVNVKYRKMQGGKESSKSSVVNVQPSRNVLFSASGLSQSRGFSVQDFGCGIGGT